MPLGVPRTRLAGARDDRPTVRTLLAPDAPFLKELASRRPHLSLALALIVLIVLAALPQFPLIGADSGNYRALAEGSSAIVPMPYASRILLPFAVSVISHLTHLSIDRVFEALAFPALFVTAFFLARAWCRVSLTPGLAALAVLASPLLVSFFATVHMPDLCHIALFLLFLEADRRRSTFATVVVMLLLVSLRETSLAIAAIAVLVHIIRRDWPMAGACLAGAVAGIAATSLLAPHSANIHHMPALAYMALKVPANFLSNVLGISLHTDAFSWCARPWLVFQTPAWLNLGNIHEVGVCTPSAELPLTTLASLLTVFGLLPGLLLGLIRRGRSHALPWTNSQFAIAFSYGLLMYVLGAMTGKLIARLIGYGWPLFFIALPTILAARGDHLARRRPSLLVVQVVSTWLPYLAQETFFSALGTDGIAVVGIAVGLPANIWAYHLARNRAAAQPPAPEGVKSEGA